MKSQPSHKEAELQKRLEVFGKEIKRLRKALDEIANGDGTFEECPDIAKAALESDVEL